MRNPNGYGTVYKLKGNRRRPWIARVPAGWDGEKQLYHTLGYFEKRQEGMAVLAEYNDNPMPKATITLGKLYDEWSAQKYSSGISKSMIAGYKAAWKYLSTQERVTMRELRVAHMQEVIKEAHEAGLSKSSLQKIRTLCSQLYIHALANDIALKDYSAFITLPKMEDVEKERFSDLEVKKIADSKLPWADTILILIYTGFRINELLGLTHFGVNLKLKVLVGGIKTEAGKDRVVPIHPRILPLVEEWYSKGGDYLICNEKGKRLSARKYREDIYRPTLEKIGVRVLDPHACRHTCASLLHAAGADTKSIQKILGHASYAITADTYTHVDVKKLQEAIQKIPGFSLPKNQGESGTQLTQN